MKSARRYRVLGRVQGVGFRWFVIEQAERLRLEGWTRNLPDGSLEVLAQGEPAALTRLGAALARGPAAARVDTVEATDAPPESELTGFHVRHRTD